MVLRPPTERETVHDLTSVRAWVEGWARIASGLAPGADSPGPPEPETERAACIRAALAREGMSLGRHFDWLTDAADADFERLLSAVRWLAEHPDAGLYVRQLPIPGIDTKWIGAKRARVTDLLRQVRDRDGDLWALTELRREPDLLRLRILDPDLRRRFGGLCDIPARVEEIAALALAPDRVFIVENLQTGLAMADLPGSVVLMARGYAIEVFATLPWLRGRPCDDWGDLDIHGLAILSRLRRYLPQTCSLPMDSDTLLAHRDLLEREDKSAPGPLAGLTEDEQSLFEGLLTGRWGERIRLEQERIDWHYAWARIP